MTNISEEVNEIMTDRKILFFDIDGTLITSGFSGKIPDSTKEAIAKARENGHLAFVNTGRVYCCISEEIKNVGFDGYVCGCGTNIWFNNEELFINKLNNKVCRDVAYYARKCLFYSLFESSKILAYDKEIGEGPHSFIVDYFKEICTTVLDDIDSDDFVFDKISAAYIHNSNKEDFFKYIRELKFSIIDRENDFCEIIPKGYSKATGIKYLLDYFDIPMANSFAFGDSNNDLDMLSFVPNSIAMGNSTPLVKEKAKYITDNVEDNGIFNAMIKLNII